MTGGPGVHKSAATSRFAFFLLVIIALGLAMSSVCAVRGFSPIPGGPELELAEAARSLWHNGSLQAAYFLRIRDEAAALSSETSSAVWQDVFTLGTNGELYPKHSIFSALVAAPFYGAFGDLGFLFFQQLCFLLCAVSIYKIVSLLTGKTPLWSVILALAFLSQTILYSYRFSYDLHGSALIMLGLWCSISRPRLGAFVLSLSALVRPANLILALPLIFAAGLLDRQRPRSLDRLLGLGGGLLVFGIANWLMFGSPIVTAYQRVPLLDHGKLVLMHHPLGLELRVLLADWSAKLFDSERGVLLYNVCLLFLPLVIRDALQRRNKAFLCSCLAITLAYFLYIFSYPLWSTTSNGNRYLLPAILLYLIPFTVYLSRFESPNKPPAG